MAAAEERLDDAGAGAVRKPVPPQKKKDKERGSVIFGRQTQRGKSLLTQGPQDTKGSQASCFDGCFAGMLGYPSAKGSSSSSSYQEPQPLKELRPVPKWEELPEDKRGIIKCVQTMSMPKEDTSGWMNQDTATSNYLRGGGDDGAAHLFCGVFDGHGKHGHEVSQVAAARLPSHMIAQDSLLQKPAKAFEVAVKATDGDVFGHLGSNVEYGGATCVSVLVDQDQRVLHVANVGDSRAVLGRRIPDAKSPRWEAIALTEDQKPDAPEELSRIELCGGHVAPVDDDDGNPVGPARVWDGPNRQKPGLGMSRTIGDHCARQYGVVPDPVVTQHKLTPEDRFIVIATDGLWDSLANEQAVYICAKFLHLPQVALKALVKAVRDEEGGQLTDDTTITLVVFD